MKHTLTGRAVPTPKDVQCCGSSIAHANCRYAGARESASVARCNADAQRFHACPYHAGGYVMVYGDPENGRDRE